MNEIIFTIQSKYRSERTKDMPKEKKTIRISEECSSGYSLFFPLRFDSIDYIKIHNKSKRKENPLKCYFFFISYC